MMDAGGTRGCGLRWPFLVVTLLACVARAAEPARVIRVGPDRAVTRIADAMRLARDGDVVLVDAGMYAGDVGSWPQSNLTIRAVRGRARIVQRDAAAEGKALWVVKGDNVVVENFEFAEAAVPDRNGAGIRHEGGRLTVRGCLFERNEMGLLTWNDERAELVVERSEFRDNRVAGDYRPGGPIGHQIYVGTIAKFTLRESYVHRGAFGHLVKSRARESRIVNNRLTDEAGGRASYELEFPSGGLAYVVGNVVGQAASTENFDIVSYGAEGYRWSHNELHLVNNTLVDDTPTGGNAVRVRGPADRVRIVNNLFLGSGALTPSPSWEAEGNFRAAPDDVPRAAQSDFRLARRSRLVGAGVDRPDLRAMGLQPDREYVHPMRSRAIARRPSNPGAMQSLAD